MGMCAISAVTAIDSTFPVRLRPIPIPTPRHNGSVWCQQIADGQRRTWGMCMNSIAVQMTETARARATNVSHTKDLHTRARAHSL